MSEFWANSGLDLLVEVKRSQRRASLEDALRRSIQSRRLVPGSRLPSSRTLASDLDWSRGTVAAAYDQLVAEGYLTSRQGAGTTVAAVNAGSDVAPRREAEPALGLDLRPGTPAVGSFPVAAWLRAGREALTRAPAEAFGYSEWHQHGRVELRSALAEYLGRARGVRLGPEQVVITGGTTQSLSLLFSTLVAAGRGCVAMEDPGFVFHRRIARYAGMTIIPLPVDGDGARPGLLRDADPSAVVVTPANQYPTGVTMHPARRSQLIEWAVATDGLVIEDDYDSEFRYDRKPIGALQGTAPDRVAYLGSVSKTLGPGLRLGWMVLPNHLVAPVARSGLLTTHGTDVTSQLTLARFLESHAYDRHIRAMRSRYRRRHELLTTMLHELSSPQHRYIAGGASAGGQAPVLLPDQGPDDEDVVTLAAAEGLGLQALRMHWHSKASAPKGLLIGFSRPPDRAYPTAIALLASILRRCYG